MGMSGKLCTFPIPASENRNRLSAPLLNLNSPKSREGENSVFELFGFLILKISRPLLCFMKSLGGCEEEAAQ